MNIRRNLLGFCAVSLIAVGLLIVVPLNADRSHHFNLGYLLGAVFGQTTLTAAWTAFGPLAFRWRFPLSLLWLLAIVAAVAGNIGFHGGPADEVPAVIGVCLAGQFAVLQIPFWGLVVAGGLRLRHRKSASARVDPREMQFGVKQLIIFTTLVAVVVGVLRLAVIQFSQDSKLEDGGPNVFVFLAVAAILVTLPLFLAALLPRFAMPAVALVLLLAGLITAWEAPLIGSFYPGGPGPNTLLLVLINGFTSAWVLTIVLIVRLAGYRFVASRGDGNEECRMK